MKGHLLGETIGAFLARRGLSVAGREDFGFLTNSLLPFKNTSGLI